MFASALAARLDQFAGTIWNLANLLNAPDAMQAIAPLLNQVEQFVLMNDSARGLS
jgi:hypothetical protein